MLLQNERNEKKHSLSLNQKALYYVHSMDGKAKSAYNESLVYSLQGDLSLPALKKAIASLVEKHEALRTFFEKDREGNLSQQIAHSVTLPLTILSNVDEAEIDTQIHSVIEKPFDLETPSLLRITVIEKNKNDHILVIVMHHIITDGHSFTLLIEDLTKLYNKVLQDDIAFETREKTSFLNHIKASATRHETKDYQKIVDRMASELKDYSGLNLLTTPLTKDHVDIYAGERAYFKINEDTYHKIKSLSRAKGVTVFHFLFSAYTLFLSHYARTQDILVGVPFVNRKSDIERQTIGYFTNILPLKILLDPTQDFSTLLSKSQRLVLSHLANQDVAFEHLATQLQLERKTLGQHPLIQTMFVWGSTEKLALKLQGITATLSREHHTKTAKFDLSLFLFEEQNNALNGYFEYSTLLFDSSLMNRLAHSFTLLIENIINNPTGKLSSFSLLNGAEEEKMKNEFFKTHWDRVVNDSLSSLFSKTAETYNNLTALVCNEKHYTYDFLEQESNKWAVAIRHLYKKTHGKELVANTLIALCVDRCEDMIIAILGILKAGAAYVPIDPRYPQDRVNYILNHSQAALLLTHQAHLELGFDIASDRIIAMDKIESLPSDCGAMHPITIDPKSTAYVLYTSGSTGMPKGVSVSHENVICLFESLKKQFSLSADDKWSLFHTYCFDISVWEIWGAFLFGGALVIVPYDVSRDPKSLYQLLQKEAVTVLSQTPSAFQTLINEDLQHSSKLEHLRYIAFVGESLKVSILRPWVEKYGTEQPRLANMYGITETTVYTNYKFITQEDIEKGRDNIGWPLEEFSMCVMDDNLHWCPVGIVGEICIGGRGLSKGYLHRDDLTHEKFIPDPYASFLGLEKNTLLYKTGDLGRWLDDGSIEYLGRKDFQIKLRGFRIELGEIEATLGSYQGVSHTAVLLKGEGDNAYLAAYFTLKPGAEVEIANLKHYLKSFLPDYMIPKTFSPLQAFPMTNNGKLNRRALQNRIDSMESNETVTALTTPLEHEIATIWADILNIPKTTIHAGSNFFELGGNSLLVIKMHTKVSHHIGKELSLSKFIAVPTIKTLASQNPADAHNSHHALKHKINQDRILPDLVQPLPSTNPNLFTPKAILLTGVTGFLGAHVLDALLQKNPATIYCLVRAASQEEAIHKIQQKLAKYKLNSSINHHRIVPILGDLSKKCLGLSAQDYQWLGNTIDAIFHVGAWVHHIFDYETLYPSNVLSVREIVDLAVTQKNKAIHFVSTLSTLLISPLDETITTEDSLQSQLNFNGYLATKWVAERLLEEAHARGIAAYVYRPGNIIAGKQGVYEPEFNHTLLKLKGMLQLKKAYINPQECVEMMPVDALASALIDIAKKPTQVAYNMNHRETISWQEYLNFAKKAGFEFELLQDEQTWLRLINGLSEENALFKISHLYRESKSTQIRPTQSLEPDHDIHTASYEELIETQLSSLVQSGFLETPHVASMR